MFSSEIKETVYIAISCMIAASVLALVAFVLSLRSEMAIAQNDQLIARESLESYKIYNKYQNETLYGEDIIALIREFEGTDIVLYIEGLTEKNGREGTYYIDRAFRQENPDFVSVKGLEFGKLEIKNPDGLILDSGIERDVTYSSFLIFGTYSKEEIISAANKKANESNLNYSDVTAIAVKKVSDGRK